MIHDKIAALKAGCPIETFWSGVTFLDQGSTKKLSNVLCPFCGHKDAFCWYPATASYHCFSCQEHGDYIDMISKFMNLSNYESCIFFSEEILKTPWDKQEKWVETSNEASRKWREGLEHWKEHAEYISDGYKSSKNIDLAKTGVPVGAFLSVSGNWTGGIQIFDKHRKRIGIQRLTKECMPGKEQGGGFFYTHYTKQKEVFLVEGVSDFLTMKQWGFDNVVGLYSLSVPETDIVDMLKGCPSIICLLDSDAKPKQGAEVGTYSGAKKALKLKEMMGRNIKVMFIKENDKLDTSPEDINDLITTGAGMTKEAFLIWVKSKGEGMSVRQIRDMIPGHANDTNDSIAENFIKSINIACVDGLFWTTNENCVWYRIHENDARAMLCEFIEKVLGIAVEHQRRETILKIASYKSRYINNKLKNALENQVSDGEFIYLINGKLSIEDDKIYPYTPEDCVFSTLDVQTESMGGKCPVFFKFMNDLVIGYSGDKEKLLQLLMEFMGYCLYPKTSMDTFFYLYGPGGNGKSTFLSIITMLLGIKNITSYDLSEVESSSHSRFDLLGKYGYIIPDARPTMKLDSSVLKKITGGDPITADQKYGQPLSFSPFCKVIMASNYSPNVGDGGEWLRRRICLIPLETIFKEHNIEPDPLILDKIEKEKEAVFWESYNALKQLLKRNHFDKSTEIRDVIDNMIELRNPVDEFLSETNDLDSILNKSGPEHYVLHSEAYREFKIFFEDVHPNKTPMPRNAFIKEIEKKRKNIMSKQIWRESNKNGFYKVY